MVNHLDGDHKKSKLSTHQLLFFSKHQHFYFLLFIFFMNNQDLAVRNIRYQIQEIPSEMKFLRFSVTTIDNCYVSVTIDMLSVTTVTVVTTLC